MEAPTPAKGVKYHKVSLARSSGRLIERTPWDRRSGDTTVRLDLTRSKQVEIAWAAGFYDGEGCTLAAGRRRYPKITISQAGPLARPPQVLVRFRQAVGGVGYVTGPELDDSGKHKPRWTYHLQGGDPVSAVVGVMWPFLGDVKRAQADWVLTRYYAQSPYLRRPGVTRGRPLSRTCKRGHDYTDAYWTGRGRNCGPCQELARVAYRERQAAKQLAS